MYQNLTQQGVRIPNGFAVTAEAYRYMLAKANALEPLRKSIDGLDPATSPPRSPVLTASFRRNTART